MKTIIKMCLFFFCVASLFAQDWWERLDPNAAWGDRDALYQRITASERVVVGEVVNVANAYPRDLVNASINDVVEVFTIRVAENLRGPQAQFVYYVRLAKDDPWAAEEPERERKLVVGNRYVFFLKQPPDQQQWKDKYKLDASTIYYTSVYRGDEHNAWRGIIPLVMPTAKKPNPQQPPIIRQVTQLCAALQPVDPAVRAAALDKLATSGDPVLAKEAQEARKGLQK